MNDPAVTRLKENILAAQVEAAMQGHYLGPFEPIEEPGALKYEAICYSCRKSVFISDVAVCSILEDKCPGG